IHVPKQVSIFFGGEWANQQTRGQQSQLTNLLVQSDSSQQQEMAKSGVRAADARDSFVEDFTDLSTRPALGDLGVQRQLQTWITTGALQAPKSSTIYVIYLGPGVK